MARKDQMNYSQTEAENNKPPMPSIKGLAYVEVPELTQEGGIPTRIYGRTEAEAKEKAAEAIKTSVVAQLAISKPMKKEDKKAHARAGKMKHDPRLLVGKEYGQWTICSEPKMIINSSFTRVKTVPVKCSCGVVDVRAPSSLIRGTSTMCTDCSILKHRKKRQEAARLRAA